MLTIYSFTITLFLILDPFGNVPLFLYFLKNVDSPRCQWVIIREMLFALAILVFFLFFGKFVLIGFNLTAPALTISGGIILFIIAIRMIFPVDENELKAGQKPVEPFLVPLAIPSVAGPSSIATVILFSTKYPERMGEWLVAMLIAWAASTVVLLFAPLLNRLLGERVLNAVGKLMGIILTVIAVQMLINGLGEAFFTPGLKA